MLRIRYARAAGVCPRSDFGLTRQGWALSLRSNEPKLLVELETASDKPAGARFGGLALEDETDPLVSSLSRPAMPAWHKLQPAARSFRWPKG